MLPLVLIFVVFYFLLIRPQQKKMKSHRALVQGLRRGDRVVTGGGLIGTVSKVVSDNELQVEISDGVRVKVVRQTIQDVLTKPEPASKGGQAKSAPANDDSTGGDKGKGGLGLGGFGLGKILGGRKSDGAKD